MENDITKLRDINKKYREALENLGKIAKRGISEENFEEFQELFLIKDKLILELREEIMRLYNESDDIKIVSEIVEEMLSIEEFTNNNGESGEDE